MPSAKCHVRAIACVALLVLLCIPALAREYRITNFTSDISVAQDGSISVHEHIVFYFNGTYHGIYRTIPIQYPGPHGSNYTLLLKVESVTDGFGNKLKYDSSVKGDFRQLKIYIPDAVDTSRTVEINYSVRNAIRWFEDHDEFYWNVTGNDWAVPIDQAGANIVFPDSAAGQLRAQAFTGIYGSASRDATVTANGNNVRVETNDALSMREGLTVDVYVPKDVLTEPSKLTFALWYLRSNFIVLLPVWAFVVMFFLWWTKGRDPKPDMSVAPMYEPPKGMTPAEVGALVDDTVHPRDITSTLVDLGVRGYIRIEETRSMPAELDDSQLKVPKLVSAALAMIPKLLNHRDYNFQLLKPPDTWSSLQPHERVILKNMYAEQVTPIALTDIIPLSPAAGAAEADQSKQQVRLSDLRNRFYTAIPTIKSDIMAELKSKGMYSVDPESAHAYVLAGVVFSALPFVLAQVFGWASILDSPLLLVGSAIASLFVVILFARIMTAKSMKGVRTKVEILGLQEFITRVDADRLKRMPPDTFEKILPYAMALGIENRWAKAFEGIAQNPPSWYVGATPYTDFNPIFFAGAMHSMAMDAQQAFVAAPRASSTGSGWDGGGGGGGGFSGGGFGGGGGDAF